MPPTDEYPHDVDKKNNVSVLAIGSEILDGRVQDTNSQFIAKILSNEGIQLEKVLICDDIESHIVDSLQFLAKHSKFIIVSGGLGPTTDDLTRESIAKFFNVEIETRPTSITRLEKLYAKRNRVLDPSNHKQAQFPVGATIIDNDVGTAEGFQMTGTVQGETVQIFSVPGVPKELKPMFHAAIFPTIKKACATIPIYRRSFRTFGLPESNVGATIKALNFPDEIFVSYRASFPEIHIVVKGKNEAQINDAVAAAKSAVGNEFIFIEDQELSLPQAVGALLLQQSKTVSIAESCTGGLLGSFLTQTPGSSKYFSGGYICYANERKMQDISVPAEIIENYGAVSKECAEQMANGCRAKTNSNIAISITGIAGPDGGSDEKPVGTFFIGVSTRKKTYTFKHFFLSDRKAVQLFASFQALDYLRRFAGEIAPFSD